MRLSDCSHVIRSISHARLSAAQARQTAARRTDQVLRRLADGQSLVLVIPGDEQGGSARWVLRISWQRKGSMRGLGAYPRVSLPEARRAATTLRAQIQDQQGAARLTRWLRASA